jgi:hypothetical protein
MKRNPGAAPSLTLSDDIMLAMPGQPGAKRSVSFSLTVKSKSHNSCRVAL